MDKNEARMVIEDRLLQLQQLSYHQLRDLKKLLARVPPAGQLPHPRPDGSFIVPGL